MFDFAPKDFEGRVQNFEFRANLKRREKKKRGKKKKKSKMGFCFGSLIN